MCTILPGMTLTTSCSNYYRPPHSPTRAVLLLKYFISIFAFYNYCKKTYIIILVHEFNAKRLTEVFIYDNKYTHADVIIYRT